MATKRPPGSFNTDREKLKWEKIQAAGTVTIDKMLSGTALPEDLKTLSKIVSEQAEVAGKIFDDGVAAAEATADAIIDKLNAERVALGKNPLTPKAHDKMFKQTFQKVLSASTEDIIGSIKDYIDEKFDSQDDKNKTLIDDAFEKLRNLASPQTTAAAEEKAGEPHKPAGTQEQPKPNQEQPKPNTAGKLDNLLQQKHTAEQTEKPKEDSPILQKLNALLQGVTEVAVTLGKEGKGTIVTTLTKLSTFFTEDHPPANIGGRHSIIGGLRRMFKDERADTGNKKAKDENDIVFKSTGDRYKDMFERTLNLVSSKKERVKKAKEKARKQETEHLAKSDYKELADVAIDMGVRRTEAVTKQATEEYHAMPEDQKAKTSLGKEVEKALKENAKLRAAAVAKWGKIEQARADYDEDKKENSWLRKVTGFFGDKHSKHESSGWLETLGGILMLALMNPDLIVNIAKTVGEYLNFETISKFVSDTWATVKDEAPKVLDWLTDKLSDIFSDKKRPVGDVGNEIGRAIKKQNIPETTTPEEAKAKIPELESRLAATQAARAAATKRVSEAYGKGQEPTFTDLHYVQQDGPLAYASLTKQLTQYKAVANGAKPGENATPTALDINKLVAPQGVTATAGTSTTGTVSAGGTTTVGAAPANAPANVQPSVASKPGTSIMFEHTPTYKDGVTVDDHTKSIMQQPATKQGAGGAGNSVSMGSFGYNSSDDTLNILNLGLLGH